MALITCPECGKQVSDRAATCPQCGCPLQSAAPTGPVPPPMPGGYQPTNAMPSNAMPSNPQPSNPQPFPPKPQAAGNQEMSASKMACPHCGADLGPKDLLSKDWAKCHQCGKAILLGGGGNAFDDNLIIELLAKFTITKDEYHKFFMQFLMENAPVDVFDNMKIVDIKRKYFWAREYGQATERAIFPLCKYGKEFFEKLCGTPYMLIADYEEHFNTKEMVPFASDYIRDTEVIPKEQSASENRFEFSHTDIGSYIPTPAYYCLPVVEEVVEYNGQQYTFIGTASGDRWWYEFDNFPNAEFLKQSPDYTSMKPVTWIVSAILILILLLIVFALFKAGFWTGVIGVAILGAIGYFLGLIVYGLIALVTGGIDAIIRAIVNRIIRKKFRARWQEFQEHKRQAAQRNFKLDLKYDVPEFPIP